MGNHRWVDGFPGAVTVCDLQGTVLEMNDQAAKGYQDQGGAALIGTNLLDCHPEPSRTKLQELLRSPRVNVYTVENKGVRKLICHVPWYADGQCRGLVELSLEVSGLMPHFVRT